MLWDLRYICSAYDCSNLQNMCKYNLMKLLLWIIKHYCWY